MAIEYPIAEEQALLEFDNFADAFCLDFDESKMDEETRAAFTKNKDRVVRAICRGSLVFNDDGEPVYTPWRPTSKYKTPLTFHERSGATLLATDAKKRGNAAKTYAMMGDLTGVPAATFSDLRGEDIKVCEALMALLMD